MVLAPPVPCAVGTTGAVGVPLGVTEGVGPVDPSAVGGCDGTPVAVKLEFGPVAAPGVPKGALVGLPGGVDAGPPLVDAVSLAVAGGAPDAGPVGMLVSLPAVESGSLLLPVPLSEQAAMNKARQIPVCENPTRFIRALPKFQCAATPVGAPTAPRAQ
jgi:hypothetical protein